MMARVLLIDDDIWLADLLASRLKNENFEVQVSANALEAIRAIDEFQPNVVVLDVFMPGPNGFVLLHELQSHADLKNIPIVVCTSSSDDLKLEMLAPYGVRALIDKTSMSPDAVSVAVRKVLL